MPIFEYQGRDSAGKRVSGTSIAVSADTVSAQLLKDNIIPIRITLKREKNSIWQILLRIINRKKITNDDLSLFTRQMYTLLKSGVPIISAVSHLAKNTRNTSFSYVLYSLKEDLESGKSLSAAMQQYSTYFTPLIVGMVRVGENTGHLDDIFLQLTNYLELEGDTVKRAKSSIRYPLFVMAAIVIGMIVLTVFVIPIFSKVYMNAHIPLPALTLLLITISDFFSHYWLGILVFFIVFSVMLSAYINSPKGKLIWDKFILKLPGMGVLLKRIILLRFAKTFSLVASSGIPISEGLSLVSQSVNNAYARQEIVMMQESIQQGNSIIQAAYACQLFTSIELQMLAVAEETGELGSMLNEIAYYYEREVDYDLKKLTDLIEPILLIAISIMVLLLALAVYLPIWNMVKLVHH